MSGRASYATGPLLGIAATAAVTSMLAVLYYRQKQASEGKQVTRSATEEKLAEKLFSSPSKKNKSGKEGDNKTMDEKKGESAAFMTNSRGLLLSSKEKNKDATSSDGADEKKEDNPLVKMWDNFKEKVKNPKAEEKAKEAEEAQSAAKEDTKEDTAATDDEPKKGFWASVSPRLSVLGGSAHTKTEETETPEKEDPAKGDSKAEKQEEQPKIFGIPVPLSPSKKSKPEGKPEQDKALKEEQESKEEEPTKIFGITLPSPKAKKSAVVAPKPAIEPPKEEAAAGAATPAGTPTKRRIFGFEIPTTSPPDTKKEEETVANNIEAEKQPEEKKSAFQRFFVKAPEEKPSQKEEEKQAEKEEEKPSSAEEEAHKESALSKGKALWDSFRKPKPATENLEQKENETPTTTTEETPVSPTKKRQSFLDAFIHPPPPSPRKESDSSGKTEASEGSTEDKKKATTNGQPPATVPF